MTNPIDFSAFERARLADEQPEEPALPPLRLERWRRSEEAYRLHQAGLSDGRIAERLGIGRTLARWDIRQAEVRRGLRAPRSRAKDEI